MFIDNKSLKNHYEIVIVGGGISGLSLARQLQEKGQKKVLVVESGNKKFNSKVNIKSYGTSKFLGNWPIKNYSSFYSRLRIFGGNAHVWGGWCMELDEYDYKNNEIWKHHKNELKQEYQAAYKILNINPQIIHNQTLEAQGLAPYTINISRGNFIKDSIKELEKSNHIDVIMNTELKKINFENGQVATLDIKSDSKNLTSINLNKLVLSAGGLENAKILLNNLPNELKSKNLGKFFMEHPQIQIGRLHTKDKKLNNFLKEFSPPTVKHLFDDKLNLNSKKYFSGFVDKNSNSRGYFVLRSSNVYQSKSLYRLRHIILSRSLKSIGPIFPSDFYFLAKDILDMIFRKIKNSISRNKSYFIVAHLEQFPDKDNFVSLDKDKKILLNWQLQKKDIENFKTLIVSIQDLFKEHNETKVTLNKELIKGESSMLEYLNRNIFGIGHHMGTTKMGINKNNSVCDLDFKLNGVSNLYLNSSSVFPTAGIANPTLTLVALSSMLAKRIKNG